MKKSIFNRIIFIIFFTVIVLFIMGIKSNAASLNISTSKSSVSPGEKFSVTVSASGGAGYANLSVSNGTLSSTSIDLMLQSSVTVTCTAGSSGSVTIKASGTIADYTTEKDESKSVSKTVKIVQPSSGGNSSGGSSSGKSSSNSSSSNNTTTTKPKESSDATLSAITVKEGTIAPEFSKDVKEYTLTVPNEITEINVTATPTDSKATAKVDGNKDLKEGQNPVTITVTAEDGTTDKYTINVTRQRAKLSLQSLIIKYQNQEGELIETPLNPIFAFDTTEYYLEDLEYWVENLSIEAIPNIEGATIDIEGADNLKVGENTITITVKIVAEKTEKSEEEAQEEETIVYTIKVNKKEEPTLIAKISDWFKGIFAGVVSWYNNNTEKVIVGALGVCVVALLGLSIYIIVDYNKYKEVINKVKKVSKMNETESVTENIIEKVHNNINQETEINTDSNDTIKNKSGKHF